MSSQQRADRASHLVIISVPLVRLARVTLSDLVLGSLRKVSDVVVVAPFADELTASFGGPNTRFVKWQLAGMTRVQRAFYASSEIMRLQGYWHRFRKQATGYFARNQFRVFGENGSDTRLRPLRTSAYWVLSRVGRMDRAWQTVDRLLGTRWCELSELTELSRSYDHVTLLQSANWGMQDRALASLARREKWRTVLVPYTTDQLDTNGFLLNSFDVICPQGPFEYERATSLHRVPAKRIRPLGSAWFRHLERIQGEQIAERADNTDDRMVVYAGVSSLYFPRVSEFAAVDAIADFLKRSFPEYRLVYRPVEFDESARAEIEQRYAHHPGVQLQWPAISEIGLSEYSDIDHRAALAHYVRSLSGCKLLIMSNTTTLCIDAAFLEGCGVVSNRVDATGVLNARHTDSLDRGWFPGLRVARTSPELLENVEYLLKHPEKAAAEASALVALWDYPEVDFEAALYEAVFGRGREEMAVAC